MALTVPTTVDVWNNTGASLATAATNHAAGDLIVACLSTQNARTFTGSDVSNTAGCTWHVAGTHVTINANNEWMFYAYNSAGNASDVVTITYAVGGYDHLVVYSVHSDLNAFTSDPLDGTSGATGTGSAIDSGNVVVSAANAVIIATMECDGQNMVAGAGYTLIDDFAAGGSAYTAAEYHVVTASEHATATPGAPGDWVILAAAFKELTTIPTTLWAASVM
jgi:hypothetical protein